KNRNSASVTAKGAMGAQAATRRGRASSSRPGEEKGESKLTWGIQRRARRAGGPRVGWEDPPPPRGGAAAPGGRVVCRAPPVGPRQGNPVDNAEENILVVLRRLPAGGQGHPKDNRGPRTGNGLARQRHGGHSQVRRRPDPWSTRSSCCGWAARVRPRGRRPAL